MGKQICLTIVWGCAEILPKQLSFLKSEVWRTFIFIIITNIIITTIIIITIIIIIIIIIIINITI